MPDHGVADLIEPVDTVERQPRTDHFRILLVDLRPVNIEHYGKNEDKCPICIESAVGSVPI